jgi:hypothetical protein
MMLRLSNNERKVVFFEADAASSCSRWESPVVPVHEVPSNLMACLFPLFHFYFPQEVNMTAQHANQPIIITGKKRKPIAAIFAVAAIAAAAMVGQTMAAFTDTESGWTTVSSEFYNLQIASVASASESQWHDTTLNANGTTDEPTGAEAILPIELGSGTYSDSGATAQTSTDGKLALIPGDSDSDIVTTFYLRHHPNTNAWGSELKFTVEDATDTNRGNNTINGIPADIASTDSPSDQSLIDDLVWSYTLTPTTGTSYHDTAVADNVGNEIGSQSTTDAYLQNSTGNVATVTVTVHLNPSTEALSGKTAYLLIRVDGTSLVAAPTA